MKVLEAMLKTLRDGVRLDAVQLQTLVSEIESARSDGLISDHDADAMFDVTRRAGLRLMVAEEQMQPSRWFYLSFADERGFLGVCWVKASGIVTASREAHRAGCNPGGEVMSVPVDFGCEPPPGSAYVLHTSKDEIDRLTNEWRDMAGGSR